MAGPATEIQESSGALTYRSGANVGTGGANVGTWTFDNSTAAFSGGTAMRSTTAADSVSFSWTGRALYLLTATRNGAAGSLGLGGEFTVQIDGGQVPSLGKFMCANGSPFGNVSGTFYRVLIPLARGLPDGPHTCTITVVGGANATVWIDSILPISGGRAVPVGGQLLCMGDSITNNGTGATSPLLGFTNRLVGQLGAKLGRSMALNSQGILGDRAYGVDGTKVGMMYRAFSIFMNNPSEFATLLIGVNDLAGTSGGTPAGDHARHLLAMLQFIEDTVDTSQARIALGTPPYIAPGLLIPSYPISNSGNFAVPIDNYEVAVQLVRQIAAQFPWLCLAQIFEVMDSRPGLVYPNALGDPGIHPNDAGHGIIAQEFLRALLGGML